jgi:hypothetical protein
MISADWAQRFVEITLVRRSAITEKFSITPESIATPTIRRDA